MRSIQDCINTIHLYHTPERHISVHIDELFKWLEELKRLEIKEQTYSIACCFCGVIDSKNHYPCCENCKHALTLEIEEPWGEE